MLRKIFINEEKKLFGAAVAGAYLALNYFSVQSYNKSLKKLENTDKTLLFNSKPSYAKPGLWSHEIVPKEKNKPVLLTPKP